ncbi:peptidoglycan-binding protein [Mesorhizobium sp. Root157]|uniref:peptidoglycan-binding protein n=1 Tax=Mesorhizobium sp. Root157 TaxID=1736477 RepID=UPI0007001B9B|nr:peptidoglycan-binding protein [Mesorhizobium sp. Root157]KQZ82822.1 peptidoglycan-binding protein [Mesorhizobium sp. Root157]
MSNKRSYLEALNASRQRKPHTTLEQLNHSLAALEARLERSRHETDSREAPGQGEPRYGNPSSRGPFFSAEPVEPPAASSFGPNYQTIARDIDRVRGQEDSLTAVGKIAGELRGLREELRHQMTAGLHQEFEALRRDIELARQPDEAAGDSVQLSLELERLSGTIQALADKSDDRSISMLRLELEQVKAAIDTLARDESVRAADNRWDDFDRRWSAFEERFDAGQQAPDDNAGIAMLNERLEQISRAVDNLPESLSLRSLEEKVRTLAGALEHFASQQNGPAGDTVSLIDERLDEISRAIVASTVTAQANAFDPAAFERIEQRIAALAAQIEEVSEERPSGEVIERLNTLSRRVDDLAAQNRLPEQVIERLAAQIAIIADRIDHAPAMPDADRIVQGLEQRFDVLAGMLERRQGDAIEQGNILFRELERRLDEVADRLGHLAPQPGMDSTGVIEAISAHFNVLTEGLEARANDPANQKAIRGLETRLTEISDRLDSSTAQFAGLDPDLIRSLEAQVAGLSAHLSQPGTPLPDFDDISPRLSQIEQSIAGTRESILDAAREAAESAVRSMSGSNAENAAVAGLAQDLKTLEALTRRSDDRNAKTFEAIHDTLLKIVERLGSLETPSIEEDAPVETTAKITVHEAPTLDLDEPLPLSEAAGEHEDLVAAVMRGEAPVRTPAEAAAEAARAATGEDTAVQTETGRKKSLFGGIARAFKGRKAPDLPTLAGSAPAAEAPAVDPDEPLEPAFINRPLEPGSGAPDLSAIMKRVRDERGQPAKRNEADAARSDFIAAARRAAQAAAAEAETLKRQSSIGGPVKALRIGDLLKARRKPILMAAGAIMLALAGLQLGKAFLSDPVQVAQKTTTPAVVQKVAQTAPAKIKTTPVSASRSIGTTADAAGPKPSEPEAKAIVVAATPKASSAAAMLVQPPEKAPVAMTAPPIAAPVKIETSAPVAPLAGNEEGKPAVAPEARMDIPDDIGTPAMRAAAAGGDARALFEIGSRYAEARGVKEDLAVAAKWYEKAAEQGLAPAQYRIGNFYEKGIGVARDIDKAKTWYQLAAQQGNASAMHNLAVLLAMGADGVNDNDAAARWFHAAADLGVKDSQFNLGILSAKGVGMKQDLEESYKWFALVAKTGDKDAAAKRDEIAKTLRPEQLEKARATTELWAAKPLDPAANMVDLPEGWQDTPTTTASIDMKKAVQNIQLILNKNGYPAGTADGVMGGKTKDAIMAFQADHDMAQTGQVDEKLVNALLARK